MLNIAFYAEENRFMQIDPYLIQKISELMNVYRNAFAQICKLWADEIVFTWHWWLALGLTIAPWVFWAFVHDKKQSHRLFNAGFITLLIASLLDLIGIYIGLWQYHTMVVPLVPAYLPFDWSFMPVTAMLFYQFVPKISPWIKAVVFSAIGSFIVEPIFTWIGIYHRIHWEYWYSFPIYIAVFMVGYAVYRRKSGMATKALIAGQ